MIKMLFVSSRLKDICLDTTEYIDQIMFLWPSISEVCTTHLMHDKNVSQTSGTTKYKGENVVCMVSSQRHLIPLITMNEMWFVWLSLEDIKYY